MTPSYLHMSRDVPLHHDHFEHGEYDHQIPGILLPADQVGKADNEFITHPLESLTLAGQEGVHQGQDDESCPLWMLLNILGIGE